MPTLRVWDRAITSLSTLGAEELISLKTAEPAIGIVMYMLTGLITAITCIIMMVQPDAARWTV
jgi:hypothetical protein